MKFENEMTCIVCPNGCRLHVIQNDSIVVKNALCPKGEEYARNEILNPVRNLTSTIRVRKGKLPLVSVRSSKPVSKGKLIEIIKILSEIDVEAPVGFHQIVVKDILGTGIDIVTTREVEKQ